MEIRLAIIGTFWLSETFLKAMDRTEGVRLAAVCSRSYEKAEKFSQGRKGVKLYTDPELLAKDSDMISPNRNSPMIKNQPSPPSSAS